jgi:hypothetical protein
MLQVKGVLAPLVKPLIKSFDLVYELVLLILLIGEEGDLDLKVIVNV